MFYERKIKYLDYIENGERIKNVGFIKIEVRDEECHIDMQIKGVPIKDTITRELLLNGCGKTSSLGVVNLLNGEGKFVLHKDNSMALGSGGLAYTELENIRIDVDHLRTIQCVWAQKKMENQNDQKQQEMMINQTKEDTNKGNANKGNANNETKERELRFPWLRGRDKTCDEVVDVPQNDELNNPTEMMNTEPVVQISEKVLKTKKDISTCPEQNENVSFCENKWNQVASIYPHICPFEDDREYLLVQPRDFVMLGAKSYPLVNNSFLLHGYYNYNHLVLTKKVGRGEDIYYIGVPGNFYDREKQVAIMFGFESFECKEEPAGQGDYGYYMIRVEL